MDIPLNAFLIYVLSNPKELKVNRSTYQRPGYNYDLGIQPSAYAPTDANFTRRMLYFMKRSFLSCKRDHRTSYNSLVKPNLEYVIYANWSYLIREIHHRESIQRAATRLLKGLRSVTYEEGSFEHTTVKVAQLE